MLLGMVTLINVTMVGAVMQLVGHIPDGSLLVILSRYLRRKDNPPGALLLPEEASSRLHKLRRRAALLALTACGPGLGFTLWATAAGWGPVAGAALAFWALAGNLGFLTLPLGSLAGRTRRMRLTQGPEPMPEGEGSAPSPPESDAVIAMAPGSEENHLAIPGKDSETRHPD
ncbi:hypothetical protein [Candidatus Solincola tengchongensis]|uniref:hypothetical protein n=1 Tax=Candidatus Solincola tengchongensis TaxID=2900693 RepID=UPI00257B703C|nr:hypothetical protein [Candidatus Solincola tengchongensis]